jgi:hypothetical protein
LEADQFAEEQVEALLSRSFTISEWAQIFQDIENDAIPDWFPKAIDVPNSNMIMGLSLRPLSILSPTHGNADSFTFQQVMSFDSSDSTQLTMKEPGSENWRVEVAPTELMSYVESLNKRLARFKATLSKPFREIETSYRLLVADLKTVHGNVALLQDFVGSPVSLKGLDFKSVWEAVEVLGKAVADLETSNEVLDDIVQQKVTDCLAHDPFLQNTSLSLSTISQQLNQIEQRQMTMEHLLNTHTERFKTVRAFMQYQQSLPQSSLSTQSPQPSSLRLEQLEQQFRSLQDLITTRLGALPISSTSFSTPMEELSTLKEEIKLLKQQIGGSGITVGHQVFQCYEEFAVWVKTGVPQGRFGLFVDGHSLLDFFSFVGFLDAESVANSFHSSNKSGFKSMLETRVAASMQNFFPAPFGKTSGDKLEDNETLPGISDPDKFDNGSTGVKYKILRGMKDVSMQLETNIEKVLKDYPDAKQMARDMLLNAKRFVIDLMNYMSQDYNSWKLRGYTKREAWRMTCRSIHRILDDLQGARMTGRDAGDGADLDRVTATYIWATAKTHEVMDEFLKYQFFEHPAIAAVLARHLAATAVLPDDQLPAKLNALDQRVIALSKKVDSLESRANHKTTTFYEIAPGAVPVSPTPPSPAPILKSKNGYRGGNK